MKRFLSTVLVSSVASLTCGQDMRPVPNEVRWVGDRLVRVAPEGEPSSTEAAAPDQGVAGEAPEPDLAAATAEARGNLKAIVVSQMSLFQTVGHYSEDFAELGFWPQRGNRYTYFLAGSGAMARRSSARPVTPDHYAMIMADEHAHPGLRVTTTASVCGGTSSPGVTGQGQEQQFVAFAVGDLDGDPAFDCWSIAGHPRRSPAGEIIPAGTPFHERADLESGSTEPHPQ